jgi:hypothetical protein
VRRAAVRLLTVRPRKIEAAFNLVAESVKQNLI